MIDLESVEFDHDVNSAAADALTVRRNYATDAIVPEWRKGQTINHEDCPIAYTRTATTLTVRATFRRLDPSIASVQVRTFNPRDTRLAGCLYWLLVKMGMKFILGPPPPPILNVLGEVLESTVTFVDNVSGPVVLPLWDTQLPSMPAGIYNDTWEWQYKVGSSDWADFATSRQKIYVLLGMPTPPWVQSGNRTNKSLPWTEALDYACRWGGNTSNARDAAGGITSQIWRLAPSPITYDCPGGGGTNYAYGRFDLTAFLDRVRGGPGRGQYVNCSDCATFVSTLANLIGCDLWQSVMGYSFDLNPIVALGSNVWQTACGWRGFFYHEVAWTGGCMDNDRVFDACLQVDRDADPTTAPHTPLQPIDMLFGAVGAGQYRDRLATPATRATCAPQVTRERRSIY